MSGHVRSVSVLFFCAGISSLGLLDGSEYRSAEALSNSDPMRNYYPQEMPRYAGVQELPVGANTRIGGAQLRMSYFTTEDDPIRVARYYSNAWRHLRLWVRSDVTHLGGVVSAMDAARGVMYQLMLARTGKVTFAYPSMTRSPLKAVDQGSAGLPFALRPGSTVLSNVTTGAYDARGRIVLSVNKGTVVENVRYYRAALKQAGYRADVLARAVPNKPMRTEVDHEVLIQRNEVGSEITIQLMRLSSKRTRVQVTLVNARQSNSDGT